MEVIHSMQNPKVKLWYQLRNKKGREQHGLFIIEGLKLIEEAVRSQQQVVSIVFDEEKGMPESLSKLTAQDKTPIPFIAVSTPIIHKLSDTKSPQGVIAIIKQQKWTMEQIISQETSFFLMIDQIQDPGNLGTIIRSADAAGVEVIILGNDTVELTNPKVLRSAMGSLFHIPVIAGNLNQLIPQLQRMEVQVIGTSPYAEQSYFSVSLKGKVAILLGNEAKGLSQERQAQVDQMVNIPLVGKAESLNAAMAATLILYERVRQAEVR